MKRFFVDALRNPSDPADTTLKRVLLTNGEPFEHKGLINFMAPHHSLAIRQSRQQRLGPFFCTLSISSGALQLENRRLNLWTLLEESLKPPAFHIFVRAPSDP